MLSVPMSALELIYPMICMMRFVRCSPIQTADFSGIFDENSANV
jgi:hypothetical protein